MIDDDYDDTDDRLTRLGALAAQFSVYLDESEPYVGLDPEAHRWRRTAKVGEEFGEVIEALLGLVGENPRKGVTNGLDKVLSELADVAYCALGSIEHLTGNTGKSVEVLEARAEYVQERAGLPSLDPEPAPLKATEFLISVDTYTAMQAAMRKAQEAAAKGDNAALAAAVAEYERLSNEIEVETVEVTTADVGSLDLLADRDALARGDRSAVEGVVTDLIAASPNAAADPEETP